MVKRLNGEKKNNYSCRGVPQMGAMNFTQRLGEGQPGRLEELLDGTSMMALPNQGN